MSTFFWEETFFSITNYLKQFYSFCLMNDKIPFFYYLDSIKQMFDHDFEKGFVDAEQIRLQKKFGKTLTNLSFNSKTRGELLAFVNTNIEIILLALLKEKEKSLRAIFEITKNELAYVSAVLDLDLDEVIDFICLGDEDQIYRIKDLANSDHREYINLVLDINYENVIQFVKILNLLIIIGMPANVGLYKKKDKIAMIDHNYTLIFHSRFYDTIMVKELYTKIKRKVPKFPKSIFVEDE